MPFELGIISDEVSDDFERACALISGWGLEYVELRMMWGKNVMQLDEAELQRAQQVLASTGLRVTAIASPVFKSPLDGKPREMEADFALGGSESFEEQLSLLEHAAGLCDRFETRFVRVFTFWRQEWNEEVAREVSSKLIQAARVARDHDVVLAVENEPVCIVGTGEELGRLWARLQAEAPVELRPHLTMLWDPGNAQAAGESAFPEGYTSLPVPDLGHVHLKDVRPGQEGKPEFVPVGMGDVDFGGQLRALLRDGYDGQLVLEPHYRPEGIPQEEAAQVAVKAAQELLAKVAG